MTEITDVGRLNSALLWHGRARMLVARPLRHENKLICAKMLKKKRKANVELKDVVQRFVPVEVVHVVCSDTKQSHIYTIPTMRTNLDLGISETIITSDIRAILDAPCAKAMRLLFFAIDAPNEKIADNASAAYILSLASHYKGWLAEFRQNGDKVCTLKDPVFMYDSIITRTIVI